MKFIQRAVFAALAALLAIPSVAQYTDQQAFDNLGGTKEFVRRRAELAKQMKAGTALLFAKMVDPEGAHYREDNDFYYYTGIADEGAVLMIDGVSGRSFLFEPEQTPRTSQVYGPNVLALSKDQQKQFGFTAVMPLNNLSSMLAFVVSSPNATLWARLGFPDKVDGARGETGRDYAAEYDHPFGGDNPRERDVLAKLRNRYPQAQLRDLTPFIDGMRNIKTPQEIEIMRRNGKISAEGNRRAIAKAKPGMYEYEIEAEAYYWYYKNGAQGMAYPAIVGTGPNVNTWHYFQNRRKTEANDLVVFDFAGDMDHLAMDITRTFNISGKFTPEQAKWYAVDLEAQKAIIDMLKPGNTYEQAAEAGKKVYEKYGIADHWYNGFGHFVGEATHDVATPGTGPGLGGPIKVGHVVTVEPIVEFPEKHIHIRVEDTILVTEHGPENLTSGVPKEMADVEKLVGSEK